MGSFSLFRRSRIIMLPQRLRWLLPALIVSWMHLQLGATLPAQQDVRGSHVSVNTFDPSAATSTMIRQDYNKRRHPPDGKNDTQSGQKLVASPAGLLRPDKFQFYTYNDKGDMITRQMTVQEIQGLIAAGGADHVAIDRQEPQKADDVLTGGKKVMDVVQKVQNVLKSALDKPPILTGSVPKIPEHANVEWSNILPSILSGETDAISPSSSSSSTESSHQLTTEKKIGGAEYTSPAALNGANEATSSEPKKPDVQTNAYGGFANNMEHAERPQYIHYPQRTPPAERFSEKPMIPVPVITLTEQKLSTLQSVITESPVFQMLSVIPVGVSTESGHHHHQITVASPIVPGSRPGQTTEGTSQTEQFVELTLSEVPETSTQSTSVSDAYLANDETKQTTASLDADKTGASTVIAHSTTTSTAPSAVDMKQTHGGPDEATTTSSSSYPPSSTNYSALAESKNNTKPPEDSSLAVTKEAEASGTQDDDKVTISQSNTAASVPLSHASTAPKPEETSNETPSHSPSTSTTLVSVSRVETSTVPISSQTDRLNEASSEVTEKPSVDSATSTYTKDHLRPTFGAIQPSISMEPLPTQLIDSFSSVMSQIAEAKPPVLSLSATSQGGLPDMTIAVHGNYEQRYNMSGDPVNKNTFVSADTRYEAPQGASQENVEGIAETQTVVAKLPPLDYLATRTTAGPSTTQRPAATDGVSSTKTEANRVSSRPPAATEATANNNNRVAPTSSTTLNVKSSAAAVSSTTSKSTTSSPVWVQLEKIQNASLESLIESSPATSGTTVSGMLQKHSPGGAASPEEATSAVTSPTLDSLASKTTQSTSASLKRPTPTKEYFDVTLMNLDLSDPVSAIDQVLNMVPLPSSTPTVEPISLPGDASSLAANDLASGLIAGFATSTSEKSTLGEVGGDRIAENASSTARPSAASTSGVTEPAEAIENVTEIVTVDRPKEAGGVTHTSTQRTLLTSPVIKVSTVESSTKAPSLTTSDRYAATTRPARPTKSPSGGNERIDDPAKIPSSSASLGNSSIDVSKGSTGQSGVTATPERPSTTTVDVRLSNAGPTLFHTNSSQDKKNDEEKAKTTEAPIVRTEASPGTEASFAKVPSIGPASDGNGTGNRNFSAHTEGSLKVETSSEKNQSFTSAPSRPTQPSTVAVHQNFSSHSVNDTKPGLNGAHGNATTDAGASTVALNTVSPSPGVSTGSDAAQNTSRVSNATTPDKNKGATTPMPPSSHATTNNRVTPRPVQANKTDHANSSTPSSPVQEGTDRPVVKVATQASSSGAASAGKEKPSRPSLVSVASPSKPGNKTSSQGDKNASPQQTTQITSTELASTSELPTKTTSTQVNEQPSSSNHTESKPASLKHSENPPKPDTARPTSPARPSAPKPTAGYKPLEKSDVSKTEADGNAEDKWTLISQQTPPVMTKPARPSKPPKPLRKPPVSQVPSSSSDGNVRTPGTEATQQDDSSQTMLQSVLPLDASQGASGLDVTVKHTSADIVNFAKLCNELAFNFWVSTNKGLSTARSLALSPFGMTSLLAMIFLGARGPTSDQMNEVLRLDDVATFNPHLVFQNITDTVSLARGQGIANAAFVRELFADKMKVRKLMPFYKEQAQQFYEGLVAEVNFATISDLVRRRTNLLIRKQTGGRIKDFVKTNTVPLRSPLAALSANVFQTDCNTSLTSSVGRDGELYFAVSPAVRQRRLVPVPATTWRSGVLAGYEPSIDATAVALGGNDRLVSTIFLLPGQQGHTAPGDTLDRLEQRLVRSAFRDGTWNKLLKVLIPRNGLELQVPKFSHRSVVNATAALKRMGLDELFSGNADFKGINGVGHRLHLADVLQMNLFSTCGDENILSGRHHVETYPASPLRSIRRRVEGAEGPGDEDDAQSGASSQEDQAGSLREGRFRREKRQLAATTTERPRLKLDRPFLYFVRHNPSGIILHMGRFNPRLLP
ncbi:PREDICTED: mucin-5AC-like [Dinoponera quadriceps]|uniref:Mucin-5AC-like n=1 Tax=Dinoponera quadriceps TaxID=609295 RepID=A0A6P3XUW8_DINQU|nr:PREDICTED: mucin-5AC-like [Dinoponera quadriceps]